MARGMTPARSRDLHCSGTHRSSGVKSQEPEGSSPEHLWPPRRRKHSNCCKEGATWMQFSPSDPVVLKAKLFTKCLSGAPSGSAPGPGGCTNEMLRVCLDGAELLELLRSAAEDFARGTAPEEAISLFRMATMTALRKPDAGPPAVRAHDALWTFTLSFGRQLGQRRRLRQHEGGEQGDPPMPLLFCLAVHNALQEVQEERLPGERTELGRNATRHGRSSFRGVEQTESEGVGHTCRNTRVPRSGSSGAVG